MNLEVLISCLNQETMQMFDVTGIYTDAIMINQCPGSHSRAADTHRRIEQMSLEVNDGHRRRMLTTDSKGLSVSRNLAIQHAEGEVCLLCYAPYEMDRNADSVLADYISQRIYIEKWDTI